MGLRRRLLGSRRHGAGPRRHTGRAARVRRSLPASARELRGDELPARSARHLALSGAHAPGRSLAGTGISSKGAAGWPCTCGGAVLRLRRQRTRSWDAVWYLPRLGQGASRAAFSDDRPGPRVSRGSARASHGVARVSAWPCPCVACWDEVVVSGLRPGPRGTLRVDGSGAWTRWRRRLFAP